MSIHANGRFVRRNGEAVVVLTRTFHAPIADVWAAVTESDRLSRWIGTWSGDPSSGSVQFQMNSEGDDVLPSTFRIEACEPPHHLNGTLGDAWDLQLHLTEKDGITTLEFAQVVTDPAQLESVGPGWEYYLDRLAAAEKGGDVSAIDFDRDYYPALSSYYSALAAVQE